MATLYKELTTGLSEAQRSGLDIVEHEDGHVTMWHMYTATMFTVHRQPSGGAVVWTDQELSGMHTARSIPAAWDLAMYLQGHIYAVTDTIKALGSLPKRMEIHI